MVLRNIGLPFNWLHDTVSQKTEIFIATIVRTLNTTYMLKSDNSSKLYARTRWWVSAARTVLPSLRHHKQFTLTPSHESKTFPSRSYKTYHIIYIQLIYADTLLSYELILHKFMVKKHCQCDNYTAEENIPEDIFK